MPSRLNISHRPPASCEWLARMEQRFPKLQRVGVRGSRRGFSRARDGIVIKPAKARMGFEPPPLGKYTVWA